MYEKPGWTRGAICCAQRALGAVRAADGAFVNSVRADVLELVRGNALGAGPIRSQIVASGAQLAT